MVGASGSNVSASGTIVSGGIVVVIGATVLVGPVLLTPFSASELVDDCVDGTEL